MPRKEYDLELYDEDSGFNFAGIHRDTQSFYDVDGFDCDGWNREGFNRLGYDCWGFNRNGIHAETGTPYNCDGFSSGYIHKDTGIKYDTDGFNFWGHNVEGFDRDGFDEYGFNHDGINLDTGTLFDSNGFNKDNIHKNTGTEYDDEGYNNSGLDSDGYNKYGFNSAGLNKATKTIYDIEGYDESGFNKDGANKTTGYIYDIYGCNRNGVNIDKNGNEILDENTHDTRERLALNKLIEDARFVNLSIDLSKGHKPDKDHVCVVFRVISFKKLDDSIYNELSIDPIRYKNELNDNFYALTLAIENKSIKKIVPHDVYHPIKIACKDNIYSSISNVYSKAGSNAWYNNAVYNAYSGRSYLIANKPKICSVIYKIDCNYSDLSIVLHDKSSNIYSMCLV
ncbi:MAG: hypothetical protein AB7U43_00045 [Desulfobacter sp.]